MDCVGKRCVAHLIFRFTANIIQGGSLQWSFAGMIFFGTALGPSRRLNLTRAFVFSFGQILYVLQIGATMGFRQRLLSPPNLDAELNKLAKLFNCILSLS